MPVVLCALFWKRTTLKGAVWGMLTGFMVTVGWVLFFKAQFYDLYEMLPGVAAGLLVTIGVSLLTAPPPDAEGEFESVWTKLGHPFRRRTPAPIVMAPSGETANPVTDSHLTHPAEGS